MPLLAVPRGASVEMVQIFLRWRLTASRYSVSPRRKGGLSKCLSENKLNPVNHL
jgi:hypothetical protein